MSIYLPTAEPFPPVFLDEELRPFLSAIAENPPDDLPRLVFADWLEENRFDDWAAATVEFIRISCRSKKSTHMPQAAYGWLRDNWRRLIPNAWIDLAMSNAELFDAIDGRRKTWFECGEQEWNGRIVRFRVWRTADYRYTRRPGMLFDDPAHGEPFQNPDTIGITRGTGYRAELQFKRGFVFWGNVFTPRLTSWTAIVNAAQPFCEWPKVGGFEGRPAAFQSDRGEW